MRYGVRRLTWLVVVCVVGSILRRTEAGEGEAVREAHIAGALCGWADTGELFALPLKGTDVKIRVVAGVVSTTVTQYFENNTGCPLEAVYIFPLPAGASVTDMELAVGDRLIRSVVQKKAEAREIYEKAKEDGRATALLDSERPNIFHVAVANFLPGETATIKFEYVEPLEMRDGVCEVTFPMVVGERYFSVAERCGRDAVLGEEKSTPMETNPDAAGDGNNGSNVRRLNPPVLPFRAPPAIAVKIEIEIFGIPVERVVSRTHGIEVEPLGDFKSAWRVVPKYGGFVLANCEFNIQIFVRENYEIAPTWVVSRHGEVHYGMLTVFPPLEAPDRDLPAQDVLFVVDTSGSMDGDSLAQAKEGVVEALGYLRPQDRFNIVRFASDFSDMTEEMVPANPETVHRAIRHVRCLEAGGGTEICAAVTHALEMLSSSPHMPVLLLFTDACIAGETALLRTIGRKRGNTRIIVFGTGSAPNDHLVRAVARIAHGEYRFIRSVYEVTEVVREFMAVRRFPVMSDLEVEWLGLDGEPRQAREQYFTGCPDLFADRPLRVFAMFEGLLPAQVRVSGLCDGRRVSFTCPLDPVPLAHVMTGRLFGRAKIDHLEWRRLVEELSAEKDGELIREITATALEYQLVTPYTSRVAVEEKLVRNASGELETVTVPVKSPKGWAMFETATCDVLHGSLGGALIVAALTLALLRRRWACEDTGL